MVGVHHLHGASDWLRCDHVGTRLHAPTGTIRLAAAPVPGFDPDADPAPWRARWVGAAAFADDPAACEPGQRGWRVGDAAEGLLAARDGAWHAAPATGPIRAVAADPCEPSDQVWVLSADGRAAVPWTESGARSAAVLPIAARFLAVTEDGLWVASETEAWFGRWGRAWVAVALPAGIAVLGLAGAGPHADLLWDDGGRAWLGRLERGRVVQRSAIDTPRPVGLAVRRDGMVLTALIGGPPPRRSRFAGYRWTDNGANLAETWEVGRWDGRGLLAVDGALWASTPTGWVRAYPAAPELASAGRIETFALDSERYGCVWHRVFLDVCLPEGARVRVQARTSDQPWDATVPGDPRPRPPEGADAALSGPPPLGSRSEDDHEGWVDVGALHQQALWIDAPAPPRGELPALDPLPRGTLTASGATHTLEGLLKNEGGRYLWLRIELVGRRSAGPSLAAIRVHAPRPTLLAFLPAFWRTDRAAAKEMEELLALFEAPLSRIEDRIDALPALFDPRATAPEALTWLSGFVGLALDPGLREGVRRTLIAEAAALYRRRGTVAAIERLCTIIAEAPAKVVEAWRIRASRGARLGIDEIAMGPGLELGGEVHGGDTDAQIRAWFGQSAHRFQVLVYRPCTPELEPLLERAIELNKPAHTAHTLCWADQGFAVGRTAAIGLGTVPYPPSPLDDAIVGVDAESVLGATTLSRGPARPLPLPLTPDEP